jgi:hypothetical protein
MSFLCCMFKKNTRLDGGAVDSVLKSDTDASILDGVKIVQKKSKQWSIENKAENQNKYFSAE